MSESEGWKPSRVSPPRGYGFYDNTYVRGDSIYNPRPDRVLPIFREEQIFVSRMMRPNLQRGWRVLDVGTGSGVYAIEAAKKGCRVVAIDNNPRACRFARSNTRLNFVDVAESAAEVREGEIAVLEVEFNGDFDMGEFDAIILSPSYTPVPTGLEYIVAPHAAAGPDGLGNFLKQIALVPRSLKEGGLCFGNQLTVVRRPQPPLSLDGSNGADLIKDERLSGSLEFVRLIKDAFSGNFAVECVPIIEELLRTEDFVAGQFEGIREQIARDKEAEDKLGQWRKGLEEEFPYFALIYYMIRKGGSGKVTLGKMPWVELPQSERKIFSWPERIRIHRAVVDHRIKQGFDPLPVFLTNGTTDSLLSYESAIAAGVDRRAEGWGTTTSTPSVPAEERDLEYNRILQKNPLALIDKEIQSQRLGELFSVIYIDTTPIHPKEGGHYQSFLERRVWINGVARASLVGYSSPEAKLAEEILNEWQYITTALQSAKCGIGFHPAFAGFTSEPVGWRWPEIISTDYPFNYRYGEEEIKIAKSIVKPLFKEKLDVCESVAPQPNFIQAKEFFYSKSTLNELEAKSYSENYDEFRKRAEQLKRRLLSLPARELHKLLPAELEREVGRLDLYACQLIMHEAIHERLKAAIMRASSIRGSTWAEESMVYSIPLGMMFYRRKADEREFPPYYKGGLWAWFVPNSRRKLRHEEAASHLLQVMWVLLTASYSAISEQEYERLAKSKVTENFAHEVKKVSNALTSEMIRPAHELFNLQQSQATAAQLGGMLGRIEFASEMEGVLQKSDVGITFFQPNAASAGSMINLWCQDPNLSDAISVVGGEHRDIGSLANACWRVCLNTLPIYALARNIVIDPRSPVMAAQSIANIKKDIAAIKGMFWPEVLVEGASRFPPLAWGGLGADEQTSAATTWLVRLLLALLNNCAAHSNPAYPVRVRITPDKTGPSRFILSISNKRRRKTGEDTESIIANLVKRGIDEKQARLGLKFLAVAAPVTGKIKVAKFGTREVVESCLEKLGGHMVHWSADAGHSSENTTSDFVVEVSIIYGTEG